MYRDNQLTVPQNGSQKFELLNKDTKERAIDVDLYSSIFVIVEEKDGATCDKIKLSTVLQPQQSMIFEIKDKGFISRDIQNPCPLEGVVQITVTEDASDKDQEGAIPSYHFLPRLTIDFASESQCFRNKKLRRMMRNRDDEDSPEKDENPLDKLIVLRQLPETPERKIARNKKITRVVTSATVSSTVSQEKEKDQKKEEKKTSTESKEEQDKETDKKTSSVVPLNVKKCMKETKIESGPLKNTRTTSSITPEDTWTTSMIENLPKPELKSVVTSLDEITPKSIKLGDVVFSDRPPKVSSDSAPKPEDVKKKSKMTSEVKEAPKSRKLDDVVFTDKLKSTSCVSAEIVQKPKKTTVENAKKRSKSPMNLTVEKKEKKKTKKNKGKCVIS